MAEDTTDLISVKFLRSAEYKGVGFKAGATAPIEKNLAERLIANGIAVRAGSSSNEDKPKAAKKDK